MKLATKEKPAEVAGLKTRSFQFQQNAKMFDIVISKLYKNKAGAVIRELSSNAWDSHVEAGKEDIPFELHLPTWLDKTFSIRDYGTGIPHDKFEDIYTNIGASTKEDSNDLIGAYGLGSKSCFCLTDTFTVENIHGKRKTTWLCFKSAGEPQVSMVGDEVTDDPSGLLVSFAFTSDAVQDFTREVVRQLRYFPVRPVITGGESRLVWPELPDGWETKDYFYVKEDAWNRKHYVVMGNVCYKLEQYDVDDKYRYLFNNSLTLKVDIGEVDVPPSREHLELTDRTKAALSVRLDKILESYQKDFEDKVAKCKTYLELRKTYYNSNAQLLRAIPDPITWNGQQYYARDLRGYQFSRVDLDIRGIKRSYKQVYRSTNITMETLTHKTITLYVNDLGRGFRQHINDNYHKLPDINFSFIIEPPSYTKDTRDQVIKDTQALGKETFSQDILLLSSVLGMPVIQKGTGVKKAKPNQFFTITHMGDYSSLKSGMVAYVGDIPKKGYYIPINGWDINDDTKTWDLERVKRLSQILTDLKFDDTVYLVRMASIKDIKGTLKGPKKLLKKLTPLIEKFRDEKYEDKYLRNSLPESLRFISPYNWKEIDNNIQVLLDYKKQVTNTCGNPGRFVNICDAILGNRDRKKVTLPTHIEKALKRYMELYDQLFKDCNYGYYSDRMIEAIRKFLSKPQITISGVSKKASSKTSNTAQTNVNV